MNSEFVTAAPSGVEAALAPGRGGSIIIRKIIHVLLATGRVLSVFFEVPPVYRR
ncbi:MAG: hypothetical protein ABSB88_12585 [Bryobacteraceae bacterium]